MNSRICNTISITTKTSQAYLNASRTLLNLLLTDYCLLSRLHSLKTYFLLSRSDYLTQFLDSAVDELRRPSKEVSTAKCQSLLDLVLQNPDWVDPWKEDYTVEMTSSSLTEQLLRICAVHGIDEDTAHADFKPLSATSTSSNSRDSNPALTGFDCLVLNYKAPFPISLILSRKCLTKYQFIFRHVLQLKLVERQLLSRWQADADLMRTCERWRTEARRAGNVVVHAQIHSECTAVLHSLKGTSALRSRMLDTVRGLFNYACGHVCDKAWSNFEEKVANMDIPQNDSDIKQDSPNYTALPRSRSTNKNQSTSETIHTVDELMKLHTDFLDTCLKDCLLTDGKSVKVCTFSSCS